VHRGLTLTSRTSPRGGDFFQKTTTLDRTTADSNRDARRGRTTRPPARGPAASLHFFFFFWPERDETPPSAAARALSREKIPLERHPSRWC
jgi:hypothetical protein